MAFGQINLSVLEGNVVTDVTQSMAGDKPVIDFRIASGGVASGGTPTFVDCSVFGNYGRALAGVMRKGAHIVVEGRLRGGNGGRPVSIVGTRVIIVGKPTEATMEDLEAFFDEFAQWDGE